jgi:flagellar motor switch protein FliM
MSNKAAGKTSEEISDLVSEKMQQLLAAVGSQPMEDTTQIEVTEHDWHQPHYFSTDQLEKLNDLTTQVAAAIAERFAQLYNSEFNVTIASATQHFAGELFEQILASGQNDYYLGFGTGEKHPFGFAGIPAQSAVTWVTQLLGDSESEKDSSKSLSDLEESLLLDITSAIVESFSDSLRGYTDIQPAGAVSRTQPPFELHGTEELCKIVFVVEQAATATDKQPANSGEAYILIPCSELAPAVGRAAGANIEVSSQDTSEAILKHLQQTPVSVTAQLAYTALTLEEVMSLRPYDVLLLDKAIDEPVELIVEGRTLFHGQPAKSAGRHAVVITQAHWDAIHNTDPVTGA